MEEIIVNGNSLKLDELWDVCYNNVKIKIDPASLEKVDINRKMLEKLVEKNTPIYGVNTGVGKLQDHIIDKDKIKILQKNIVRSHSSGVGAPLPEPIVRGMMLIRLNTLLKGYSGVRKEVVELIASLLNNGIYPYIPTFGSVGASGDLAPLAAFANVMIGEGYAIDNNHKKPSLEVLRKKNITPIELEEKEGLAIINATSLLSSYLGIGLKRFENIINHAEKAAAFTFDALHGNSDAFDPMLHMLKPHKGQIETNRIINQFLNGSKNVKKRVSTQDPYTLRAIPQVIGATRDLYNFCKGIFEIEANSFVDNPLILEGRAISGANFHGQYPAMALDLLALGLNYIGGFAERRIEKIISGGNGISPFLSNTPGLSSGLMIAQYTAAALQSYSKILAHPSSSDSIPTSLGQEDFVSMGANSGKKLMELLDNTEYIISIEFLASFRYVLISHTKRQLSSANIKIYSKLEDICGSNTEDMPLTDLIEKIKEGINQRAL